MLYFQNRLLFFDLKRKKINKHFISGSATLLSFFVGDVMAIGFRSGSINYFFEGICIAIKNKNSILPDTSFILRNVISSVGVEVNVSFFYNLIFFTRFSSYKRKREFYNSAKIYYVRNKLNNLSRII